MPYNNPVPLNTKQCQVILTQYHQLPTSTASYWPSTIMDQPLPPYTDPVPPSTDQYCLLLNQYHCISTSTAPYWSSTTKYQSIPTYTDPVPSYINQYHLLLTQYHQVPTAAAFYWPSVIMYQPVPLHTDQVSTRTNLYSCCLGITDSCTVYPGSCFFSPFTNLLVDVFDNQRQYSYIIDILNFVNIKLARIIYWQYSLIWSIQYTAYKKNLMTLYYLI